MAKNDRQEQAAPDLSHIAESLRPLAVPVADLAFDPANARKHSEDNLNAIRGSLRVYGQRRPIVVNRRTMAIEAGNGLLQATLSLNWSHVAAVLVDDDPATATGFTIADNRTAELADWDDDNLGKLLADVGTGFDEDLDQMMSDLAAERGLVPEDDSPGTPRAKKFDVLVECVNEEQRESVLANLAADGIPCRAMGGSRKRKS